MRYVNVSPASSGLGKKLCAFFFQAEDGIRDRNVTGVQTCALPICLAKGAEPSRTFVDVWDRGRAGYQGNPAKCRIGHVPKPRARPCEIPVQGEGIPAVAEQRVPRRPIVVADDLVRVRTNEPPPRTGRRHELGDEVVIAAQMPRCADHVILAKHRVRKRHGVARVDLALDEAEDLASLRVGADHTRRVESFALEKSQERMHGWSPRTGAAVHSVADADGVIQVSAERSFFGHREGGYASTIAR